MAADMTLCNISKFPVQLCNANWDFPGICADCNREGVVIAKALAAFYMALWCWAGAGRY